MVYRFATIVDDKWMSTHFKRICFAIDQLLSKLDFDVPALSESTGLSQDLRGCHLTPSEAELMSLSAGEHIQSGKFDQLVITPSASFTDSGTAKRKRST